MPRSSSSATDWVVVVRRCLLVASVPVLLISFRMSVNLSLSSDGGDGGGGGYNDLLISSSHGNATTLVTDNNNKEAQILLDRSQRREQVKTSTGRSKTNQQAGGTAAMKGDTKVQRNSDPQQEDKIKNNKEPTKNLQVNPSATDAHRFLRNRPAIQDILDAPTRTHHALNTSREFIFKMDNHTWLSHRTATTHGETLDMTQNFQRIHEYRQGSSDNRRSYPNQEEEDSHRHTQSKTTTRDDNDGKRLNIVLFYADDWTMQVLGALNPYVQTPNIDAMARRGMLFTRNCVTTSICWISRNTLATGVYSSVHRHTRISDSIMFNHSHFDWMDTTFPLLRRHGYFTGLVGKWHAPAPTKPMKAAFDLTRLYYGDHVFYRHDRLRHVTDVNGEDAMSFLHTWNDKYRRTKNPSTDAEDRPFFLQVSFFATHAWDNHDPEYLPMKESMHLYRNTTIPRPPTATERHYQDLPWFMRELNNEAMKRNRGRFDNETNYEHNIKNLYRMATEVDAVVGAVIDELKALGVYDNTLLIFTTDNGNLHGEHGLAEKWFPYEESIRVPLVVEDPRMARDVRGTRNDEFTLSVDLAPTILSAAQIPVPQFMQGRDLAQLYVHPSSSSQSKYALHSWRQDFFYEWNTVRVYVTKVLIGVIFIQKSACTTREMHRLLWASVSEAVMLLEPLLNLHSSLVFLVYFPQLRATRPMLRGTLMGITFFRPSLPWFGKIISISIGPNPDTNNCFMWRLITMRNETLSRTS